MGLVAALVVTAVAGIAYNLGLSQGLAEVGAESSAYRWHGHWGFGPFPGLFFLIFLMMAIRGLWWRPWGHWSYYGPRPDPRDRFEEWHRQAHERMGDTGKTG